MLAFNSTGPALRRMSRLALIVAAISVVLGVCWRSINSDSGWERTMASKTAAPSPRQPSAHIGVPTAQSQPRTDSLGLPDRNVDGVDGGNPLEPGFADLTIRVLTHENQPRARAVVCVETAATNESALCISDEHGIARLQGLAVGRVCVRGLNSGQVTASMQPGPNEVVLVEEPHDDLTVRVLDQDARAVKGANVFITDANDRTVSALSAISDDQGTCRIPGVAPTRRVFATKRGYEQSAAYPLWASLLEPPRTLLIELAPGGCCVRGSVRGAEDHSPIPGATIRMFGLGNQTITAPGSKVSIGVGPTGVRLAITGSSGEFEIEDAMAPPFKIQVLAVGFASAEQVVDATAARAAYEMEFALELSTEICGLVVDDLGRPVREAVVSLSTAELGYAGDAPICVTNDAGRFRFANLRAGPYTLRADATGGRRASVRIVTPSSESTRIWLPAVQPEAGRVVSEDGAPIQRWNVGWSAERLDLDRESFPREVTGTDATGRFWLPQDCPEDGWVYAWPPGGAATPFVVARRVGNAPLDVAVNHVAQLSGAIVFRANQYTPEEPPCIRLIYAETETGPTAGMIGRGDLRIDGLPCGVYRVHVGIGFKRWKDAGTVDILAGNDAIWNVPPSNVILAYPDAR